MTSLQQQLRYNRAMSLNNPFIDTRIAQAMQSLGGMEQSLPEQVLQAGGLIAAQLVAGQKVVAMGLGSAGPLAQMFSERLLHDKADRRPALPALWVNDASSCKTLSKAGDCLVLIALEPGSDDVTQILDNAQANNVNAIVISGQPELNLPALKNGTSIYLPLNAENLPRMQELSLFILNCLGDIIEEQLFGSL